MQRDKFRQLTIQALHGLDAPRPHFIEALVLHTLSFPPDEAIEQWHAISKAFRIALLAGLHRNATEIGFSRFELEMRRRQWLVVREMEISISNSIGMVSACNSSICDTALPSNYIDADLSITTQGMPRSNEEYTQIQGQIYATQISEILSSVVLMSQQTAPSPQEQIDRLHKQMLRFQELLPANLRMSPLQQSILDSSLEVCDRVRIEFLYQQALCVLFKPSLQTTSLLQRNMCLKAAVAIVDLSIALLKISGSGGQLSSRLPVLLQHVHDFKVAALILCSEEARLESSSGARQAALWKRLLYASELWSRVEGLSKTNMLALSRIAAQLRDLNLNTGDSVSGSASMDDGGVFP